MDTAIRFHGDSKAIKLTFKSDYHRGRATVGSRWPGLLPSSILLPSCPWQSHEYSSGTKMSLACQHYGAALPTLPHGCSRFRSSLGRHLSSPQLPSACEVLLSGHPCCLPPRLAESWGNEIHHSPGGRAWYLVWTIQGVT